MAVIESAQIEQVCYNLLSHASIELPPGVEAALRAAEARESQPTAKQYFGAILENLAVARTKRVPICQDTGVPLYYVTLGSDVVIKGGLHRAIESATIRATKDTPLREQVMHPLHRINPGTNVGWGVPPIFLEYADDADWIEILAVPRGGGAEAKWQSVRPIPASPREKAIIKTVLEAVAMPGGEMCPPTIVGVAIGGFGMDYSEYLARKALYRTPLNSRHPDPLVAELEDKLYTAVNRLGIGPHGVGGDTSCLALHVEVAGSHGSSFPISVAFYCWASRYSKARIHGDGRVEYLTHPALGGNGNG